MSAARDGLPKLPPRPQDGHKGTFGTVLVVGGSSSQFARMIGAPAFTALAALRAGCGVARVLAPAAILDHILALCPCATGLSFDTDKDGESPPHHAAARFDRATERASCIVIGPGLSRREHARALVLRALQQVEVPVVADADALFAFAEIPDAARDIRAKAVLTPHPGEFAKLGAALGIALESDAPGHRANACERLAQRLGCVVVLKGAGTVVSNGLETWTCPHGHPCLATAGTGDVLAGLLGGIIAASARADSPAIPPGFFRVKRSASSAARTGPHAAEGVDLEALRKLAAAKMGVPVPTAADAGASGATPEPALSLIDAAKIAVSVHALAGEAWAKERGASAGMLASELVELLPGVLEAFRS